MSPGSCPERERAACPLAGMTIATESVRGPAPDTYMGWWGGRYQDIMVCVLIKTPPVGLVGFVNYPGALVSFVFGGFPRALAFFFGW